MTYRAAWRTRPGFRCCAPCCTRPGKPDSPGLDDKVLGGLERADDRGARQCRDFAWTSRLDRKARAPSNIERLMGQGAGIGTGSDIRGGREIVRARAGVGLRGYGTGSAALYEATGEAVYLERALAWQTALDAHYFNPATARYFLTADDAQGLVVRPQSTFDEAIPNPNGLIAQNLVRLAALTGDDQLACEGGRYARWLVAALCGKSVQSCQPARCARHATSAGRDRGDG